MAEEKLAIDGGPKAKPTPYGTGKRFGLEEARELLEALNQNTLFYMHGNKVKTFVRDFAALHGADYAVATSSGTAAIHVALGAAGVSVGDEVITSPITDMGTLIGILYQNAIPVFADLEPYSANMSPDAIARCVTDRTKAILVVHLAGNPADMDRIMEVARAHGLAVVEDCAQSVLARHKGRYVGTIGDFGAFSTNDYKHMSTGDGGVVLVNGDEATYRRTHMFADKNYNRFGETVRGTIPYLAPNYRMTELQGAVGIAQLKKLPGICARRAEIGSRITEGIRDLPGIHPHAVRPEDTCTYWFYMFRSDEERLGCSRQELVQALAAEGISAGAGYIPTTVCEYALLTERCAYQGSHFPFDYGRDPAELRYGKGTCPVAEEILATCVRLGVNEFWTDEDVEQTIAGIRKVARHFSSNKERSRKAKA